MLSYRDMSWHAVLRYVLCWLCCFTLCDTTTQQTSQHIHAYMCIHVIDRSRLHTSL